MHKLYFHREVILCLIFNNGILLNFSNNGTQNTSITFPLAYSKDVYLIGVGFVINGVGAQYRTLTKTGFTTSSNLKICDSLSWLAIGI